MLKIGALVQTVRSRSGDTFRWFSVSTSVYPRRSGVCSVSWGRPEEADAVVRFVSPADLPSSLPATFAADFNAKSSSVGAVFSAHSDAGRTLFVKLPSDGKVATAAEVRKGAAAVVSAARARSTIQSLSISLEGLSTEQADAAVQASILANYWFDPHLGDAARKGKGRIVPKLFFSGSSKPLEDSVVKANATLFARDVANERADVMNPAAIQAVAAQVAESRGLSMVSIVGEDLVTQGLHMLHAVGKAAPVPPRLLVLKYEGDPAHPEDVIALVGKGICFDTGGLNLKPTGSIETMHFDKGGAAAVLAAADAIPALKLKKNVVFALALAENSIDALSYKPHAALTSLKGLTVEVKNTDAEGRLVLGDAMWYVQQSHKPHTLVDVATLTGACVVALGEYLGGLFSNDDGLVSSVMSASGRCAERVWRLPILPDHTSELDNDTCDIGSTGAGRYGGACTAAAFLQKFVDKDVKWAHFDIAGPGMYSKARGEMCSGGTGFGARLLIELVGETGRKSTE